MSVQIFYDIAVFRIPAKALDTPEDVYGLCFLSGDSRTYTHSGQRERRWTCPIVGFYDDVIAHQLTWVNSQVYWKTNGASGATRDFQWLSKIRKSLDTATEVGSLSVDFVGMQVGDLSVEPHRRCKGMTIREALSNSMALRSDPKTAGDSDWDALRILGPGSN